jgi:hypothetical protein
VSLNGTLIAQQAYTGEFAALMCGSKRNELDTGERAGAAGEDGRAGRF